MQLDIQLTFNVCKYLHFCEYITDFPEAAASLLLLSLLYSNGSSSSLIPNSTKVIF